MAWLWDDELEFGKFCRECDQYLALDYFTERSCYAGGRDTICRPCQNYQNKLLYRLRRENPAPVDGRCETCGGRRALECDHSHDTNEFRNWLCRSCNRKNRKDNEQIMATMRAALRARKEMNK